MALVLDDVQRAGRPGAVQPPGSDDGAADVAATVDQHAGDVGEAVRAREHGTVAGQEAVVRPDVRGQRGEDLPCDGIDDVRPGRPGGVETDVRRLPPVPGVGRRRADGRVRVAQEAPVRLDDALAGAPLRRDRELLPLVGEEPADALGDPVHLLPARRGDGEQDEPQDAVRVFLRVGERQRAPPGDARDDPPLDPEVRAERLEVVDHRRRRQRVERPGFVQKALPQVGQHRRGAAAATALVQADHEVAVGVEPSSVGAVAQGGARTTVEVDRRCSGRGAGRLPREPGAVRAVEQAAVERRVGGVHAGNATDGTDRDRAGPVATGMRRPAGVVDGVVGLLSAHLSRSAPSGLSPPDERRSRLPSREARWQNPLMAQDVLGRDTELRRIGQVLDRAATEPAYLCLTGEPGIGKTTLLQAARRTAADRGFSALSCGPAVVESEMSYAGLTDLLSPVTDHLDELPEPQRIALEAALLRRVRVGHQPDVQTVGAGTLSLLTIACARRPVLVAVDDLQWLDEPSLRALAFAVRRCRAPHALVVAVREGHRMHPRDRLRDLRAREPAAVDGAGSRPAARAPGRGGHTLDRPAMQHVMDASRGNPLFARELARGLDDGLATSSSDLGSEAALALPRAAVARPGGAADRERTRGPVGGDPAPGRDRPPRGCTGGGGDGRHRRVARRPPDVHAPDLARDRVPLGLRW